LLAKEEGKKKTILFNLSGHGYMDLQAYADYHDGKLKDFEYPAEEIKKSSQNFPRYKYNGEPVIRLPCSIFLPASLPLRIILEQTF